MTKLYWHLALTGVILFGGLVTVLLAARFGQYSDVVIVVFLAGAVGAVVNNYYRLAKLSAADKAAAAQVDGKVLALQIYVSPLIAGILAFVMYGLCLSGLLAGALFPQFTNTELPYKGLSDLLTTLAPKTNIDTAKAILWAFIAGFSERLIPNVLDRLVAKAEALKGE